MQYSLCSLTLRIHQAGIGRSFLRCRSLGLGVNIGSRQHIRGFRTSSIDLKVTRKVKRDLKLQQSIPRPIKVKTNPETGIKQYVLPPLSDEQKQTLMILAARSQNVVINACAGSGKTTTLLQMAKFIKENFLVLLYNRRLRAETIEKAQNLHLHNLNIDNYHGLGYRYYTKEADTDQGLKRIVEEDLPPLEPLPDFDYLVLDEQQDMNPIIYNFVQKVLRDAGKTGTKSPQLLLLGDPRQEIYQFNNADKRFLTLCQDLFPGQYVEDGKTLERTWVEINQSVSFRMTKKIGTFANKQLLKDSGTVINTIKDHPDDPKPRYVVCDAYSDPFDELCRLLDMGLDPSEILVMAPSLRSAKSPIRNLANRIALERPDLRIHIPSDDDDRISEKVSSGKIVFASYHQAKGIEREAAILFNFDDSYYRFYDRDTTEFINVGNVQYVAATRAKKHLVLIHHFEEDYLPFIDKKNLSVHCETVRTKRIAIPEKTKKEPRGGVKNRWKVTDLTRNIPETVVSSCFEDLELELLKKPNKYREWPDTQIKIDEDNWESVADITGTAVPAIFEYEHRGTCTLIEEVLKDLNRKTPPGALRLLQDNETEYVERLRKIEKKYKANKLGIPDILYTANISNMIQSGYLNKVLNIPAKKYAWFTDDHAKSAFNILKRLVSDRARYEKLIANRFDEVEVEGKKITVVGRVDLFDFHRIWELKWTSSLRPEHVLQLALYGAIEQATSIKWAKKDNSEKQNIVEATLVEMDEDDVKLIEGKKTRERKPKTCHLLHVPTSQRVKVSPRSKEGYINVVRKLIRAKTEPPPLAISDKEFLREAKLGFPSIVGKCTVPSWLSIGNVHATASSTTENGL